MLDKPIPPSILLKERIGIINEHLMLIYHSFNCNNKQLLEQIKRKAKNETDLLEYIQSQLQHSNLLEQDTRSNIADRSTSWTQPDYPSFVIGITSTQRKVLISTLYIMLYGTMESIVNNCVANTNYYVTASNLRPHQLPSPLLLEWFKHNQKRLKSVDQGSNKQSNQTIDQAFWTEPITESTFEIKLPSLNVDRSIVSSFLMRATGRKFEPSQHFIEFNKKSSFVIDQIEEVTRIRNNLAHGNISHIDQSVYTSFKEVYNTSLLVTMYLTEVVQHFEEWIQTAFPSFDIQDS